MKTVVCLKRVLDPAGIRYSAGQRRLLLEDARPILGPADRAALEMALRLRGPEGRVTLLTVGPAEAESTLREALAAGADEAVLCVLGVDAGRGDRPVVPAVLPDSALVARLLAAAISRLGGADLVLCGARSLEGGRGQVGPRLAEELGWGCVTQALSVEAAAGEGEVIVERRLGNVLERVAAVRPAVVTVAPGAAELRLVSPLLLMRALRSGRIQRWTREDLGLDAEAETPSSTLAVRRLEPARGRRTPQVLTPDSPEEAAELVLGQLLERRLVR